MRFVQVHVPDGTEEAIITELEKEDIDYVISPEIGRKEYSSVVSFPLPRGGVEPVLGRLREVGVEEDGYTIVVAAETVVSKRFERLLDRYTGLTISRAELAARAEEMAPAQSTFIIMTVVSAIVATTGLLLDSGAVIIGAMVIAPVMGPAVSTAVGTVLSDRSLLRRGIYLQGVGLVLAVVSAALFSQMVQMTLLVPPHLDMVEIAEIQQRLTPDVLSLVLAIGAGIAAIVSLTRGVAQVIVGAMIAVALVPPASTVGIALAWGQPTAAVGAGILTLVNALAVNLVALLLLRSAGYRPQDPTLAADAQRQTRQLLIALVSALVVLSLILAGVSFLSYQASTFENQVHEEVTDLLSSPEYDDVTLVEISQSGLKRAVMYNRQLSITVTVDTERETRIDGLARQIDDHITEETGRRVYVTVLDSDYSGTSIEPNGANETDQQRLSSSSLIERHPNQPTYQ